MKKRASVIYVIIQLLAFLLLLSSCGPGEPEKSGNAMSLRLAYPNKVQYAPFIIGMAEGIFREHGLEVSHIVGTGGIDAAEALGIGEADIGAMGDVPAVILLSRSQCRLLASFMTSATMHTLVAAPGSGIRKIADLTHKRVAVHFGSSTHGALLSWLASHFLNGDDIRLIPLSPQNFPEAMQRGEVDAVAGSEPWPRNVLERCPGAYQVAALTVAENFFPHVLVAPPDFISRRPLLAKRFFAALGEIEDMIRRDPEKAARIVAQVTGRRPALEEEALGALGWEIRRDAAIITSLDATASFLRAEDIIKEIPDIKSRVAEDEKIWPE